MVTDELLEFVRTQYSAGMPQGDLKQLLITEGGWDASDVDEALRLLGVSPVAAISHPKAVSASQPEKTEPHGSSSTPPNAVSLIQTPAASPSPSTPTVTTSSVDLESSVAQARNQALPRADEDFLGMFSEGVSGAPQSTLERQEVEQPRIAAVSHEDTGVGSLRGTDDAVRKEEEALLGRLATNLPQTSADPAKESITSRSVPVGEERTKTLSQISSVRFSLTDALRSALPKDNTITSPEPRHTTADSTGTDTDSAAPPKENTGELTQKGAVVDIRIGPSSSGREQIVSIEPSATTTTAMREAPTEVNTSVTASPQKEASDEKIAFNIAAIANTPSTGTIVRHEVKTNIPDLPRDTTTAPTPEQFASKSALAFAKRTMASDILSQEARPSILPSSATQEEKTVGTHSPQIKSSGISSVLLAGTPQSSVPTTPLQTGGEQGDNRDTRSLRTLESPRSPGVEKKRRNIMMMLGFIFGALSLVAAGVGAFLFWGGAMGRPDAAALVQTAATRFFGASTWSYKSTFSVNVTIASPEDSGMLKHSILRGEYQGDGTVSKGQVGLGDGIHHVVLKGEFGEGDTLRGTDVSLEIRRIGNVLFLHVVKAPPGVQLPTDVLSTYWVRIDLAELGRELGWKGLEMMGEEYGTLAGGSGLLKFENIILTDFPFVATSAAWTGEDGARRATIALAADPDRAIAFMQALYRKFRNTELLLSEEDRVRLKDALRKVRGELIVVEGSGVPELLTLSVNLDDTLFGKRVSGSGTFTFAPEKFDTPLSVTEPTPILSTEELQREIERYNAIAAVKASDDRMIATLMAIREALEAYRVARGKYPLTLGELHAAGMLETTTVPASELKTYAYAVYVDAKNLTRAGRCSVKGKICAFYHIGVNLEYLEHPALKDDADLTSDVRGSDAAGCTLEKERACYDLTPPQPTTPTTATSTSLEIP